MSRTPIPVARALQKVGYSFSAARKLQRITSSQLADRAGISRATLSALEHGAGGTSIENLLRVARALGIMENLVASLDPYSTDVGKLRVDEILPQRVRHDQ
ncbi:helix-turn-helix domain-containing protein (plasmid) [Pseudarthrobacter sp. P1]|uniref:helix-turn-helix domain-containing protein n=1 Tax=Pseudarthrobacter sp. P1 TaxID=3418418 RepID=UPI003CE691B1